MENFGIVFSVPAAFVLSTIYGILLVKVVRGFDGLRRFLYAASLVVLGLFLVELVLLASLGAVRSRAIIGPSFYIGHVAFFFLGTPALANALVLRGRGPLVGRQYITVVVCTVFALFLVLTQYSVSEALYGVDGTNGPYSYNGSVKSRLEADVSSGATSFDFAAKTPFAWDRMYVFGPYTSESIVESTLGFRWPDYRKTTIKSSDSVCLVVFVQDGKVVYWYEQPRAIELGGLANGNGYARSEAKFQVSRTGGRAELQPIEISSPTSAKQFTPSGEGGKSEADY